MNPILRLMHVIGCDTLPVLSRIIVSCVDTGACVRRIFRCYDVNLGAVMPPQLYVPPSSVGPAEFYQILLDLGFEGVSANKAQAIFSNFDKTNSGFIQYQQLLDSIGYALIFCFFSGP